MNLFRHFRFTESFLAILVLAVTAQHANAVAWSLGRGLAYSWIGSALILTTIGLTILAAWRKASTTERADFISAWSWPLPWVFLAVMLWQIVVFPPTMSDSLCYRLPRIFLWLQDGYLSQTNGSDGRMREMPWGWEILALPFVALNRVNLVGLVNLAAWAATLQLFQHWALSAGAARRDARWISLALASAPVFLLQASSSANDLFASVALMASVHFILFFASDPQPARVHLSLIAFMLACGVKPQFLTLGIGWGAWWILGAGKPWKHTGIAALALTSPFALLVSPLPAFSLNYLNSGSLFGADIGTMLEGKIPPALMALAATVQFLATQLQLPVMPGAEAVSSAIQSFDPFQAIQSRIPQFSPGVGIIPIIDSASFGFFHFTMICAGAALALRERSNLSRSLVILAVTGFLIAASQVVPTTIGRSFIGFVAIILPLSARGLASANTALVKPICLAVIAAGFLSMILNPSKPAWPSRSLQSYAATSDQIGLMETLARYHAYQERALTGVDFLKPVPAGEPVAILVRGFTPLVGLWTPNWRRNRVVFVHQLNAQKFQQSEHRWLVIGDRAADSFPEHLEAYRSLSEWRIVSEKEFRPVLSQAPEKWTLYTR